MKDRTVIVKIGYEEYTVPDCPIEILLRVIERLTLVKKTYVEGEYIYEPKEEKLNLELYFIAPNCFREVTKAELENKEIKDLKNSLDYAKQEKDRRIKEKTCIENELKVLKGEEAEPEKEEIS